MSWILPLKKSPTAALPVSIEMLSILLLVESKTDHIVRPLNDTVHEMAKSEPRHGRAFRGSPTNT